MNLVLVGVDLLVDPVALDAFREATDPDLQIQFGMVTEMPSGETGPSRTISLSRERIILTLSQSRSSIIKEYPEQKDLERLAEVATSAIDISRLGDKNPRAFGYNIELVYDPNSGEPASRYLGNQLFGGQSLGGEEWELAGGTGQMIFNDKKDDTRQWTVNIRPRSSDVRSTRVFLGLNLHYSTPRIHKRDEIKTSLDDLWVQATDFVDRLSQRK